MKVLINLIITTNYGSYGSHNYCWTCDNFYSNIVHKFILFTRRKLKDGILLLGINGSGKISLFYKLINRADVKSVLKILIPLKFQTNLQK